MGQVAQPAQTPYVSNRDQRSKKDMTLRKIKNDYIEIHLIQYI
jgi:hypothetical protein